VEIIDEKVLLEQKWILVKEKLYRDKNGKEKSWSFIERRNRRRAAVIAATTRESRSLLVIKQFRVPFGSDMYEFPAGLIDDGETAAQAAERELLEETGYSGRVLEVGPEISSTSGLSTETVHMVYMETEELPSKQPDLEGSEEIEVFSLRQEHFRSFIKECEEHSRLIDAKLYLYLRENS
jgi:ADP-ribose pyrophosphatase